MLPSSSLQPPPPLRTGPDVTAAAATAADATMQPTMVAPASPVPLQPPPASARSSGVPALLTPGATASLPPSLSSASSSLSALSSSSPTPPSSTAAIVAATTSLHAGASVSAPSPDFSSYDPAESTAASAGISLKPALAGNLAATTASQAQLGQPLNHRASGTRARATQLLTRLPDPPPATVHELVHQPGTVWGFVEKLTSSQDRARDPGPCAATEPAKTGLVSPMAAELQWTPRLLVLSDTGLYLFSTTHDPYSQPALDALRLGPGSSLRIVADPGSPSAVILTVSNESREWDLRCTPLMPAAPTTTGARDAEAAAAVADPARAPVPDLETQAWSDRLRAAIQLGRSRSKSDVLRRANLEHAIGTAADAAAAAAAAAIANSQPRANDAPIPLQAQLLQSSEIGQLYKGFPVLSHRPSRSSSLRLFHKPGRFGPAPPFMSSQPQPPPPSSTLQTTKTPTSAPRRSRSISLTRIRAQQPASSTGDSPPPAPPVPSIPPHQQLVLSPLSPPLLSPDLQSATSSASYTSLPPLSAPSPALSSPDPTRTPTLSGPRRPSTQHSNSAPTTPSPALSSAAGTPTGTPQPTSQQQQHSQQERTSGLGLISLTSLFSSTSRRGHQLARAPTLNGVIRHSADERGRRAAAPTTAAITRQSADLPAAGAARRWMAGATVADSTAVASSAADGSMAATYAQPLEALPADAGGGLFGLRRVRSQSAGDLSGTIQFYTDQRYN